MVRAGAQPAATTASYRASMREVLSRRLSLDDAAPTHPHRRVVLLARTCRRGDRPARAAGAWARVVLPPYEQPEGRAPLEPPSLPRPRASSRRSTAPCAPCQPPRFAHGEAVEGSSPGTGSGDVLACEVGGICPDETALYRCEQRHGGRRRSGARSTGGRPASFPRPDGRPRHSAPCSPPARLLDELDFEHLLLAHGDPLIGDGRALQELVATGGQTAFET